MLLGKLKRQITVKLNNNCLMFQPNNFNILNVHSIVENKDTQRQISMIVSNKEIGRIIGATFGKLR